jgi:hypothetical protein
VAALHEEGTWNRVQLVGRRRFDTVERGRGAVGDVEEVRVGFEVRGILFEVRGIIFEVRGARCEVRGMFCCRAGSRVFSHLAPRTSYLERSLYTKSLHQQPSELGKLTAGDEEVEVGGKVDIAALVWSVA